QAKHFDSVFDRSGRVDGYWRLCRFGGWGDSESVDEQILAVAGLRSTMGHRGGRWSFSGSGNCFRALACMESSAAESHRRPALGIGPQKGTRCIRNKTMNPLCFLCLFVAKCDKVKF